MNSLKWFKQIMRVFFLLFFSMNFFVLTLSPCLGDETATPPLNLTEPTSQESFGEKSRMPLLFEGFWKNVTDSFTGSNILFDAAGVLSTPMIIESGIDAHVYDSFRHSKNDFAWGGAVLGSGAGAAIAGLGLYLTGSRHHDPESVGGAIVIAQASLITGAYIKALKIITGRAHPTNTSALSSRQQTVQFDFGKLHWFNGYGWPSGHVSHTVAVTSALAHYYTDKDWLKWFGLGISSYMLYTVSAFDSAQMHWFSDGVAGAFMGYAIGSTVGKNFRKIIDGKPSSQSAQVQWYPLLTSHAVGIGLMTFY